MDRQTTVRDSLDFQFDSHPSIYDYHVIFKNKIVRTFFEQDF